MDKLSTPPANLAMYLWVEKGIFSLWLAHLADAVLACSYPVRLLRADINFCLRAVKPVLHLYVRCFC